MKFAMLFPGQGSQYLGMCGALIKSSPEAARVFERASSALGFDIADMIANAPMKVLTQSENAQPAVVAASYALFEEFMREIGARPQCLVGHSLGEISALVCSGSMSFEDGMRFALARGRLMQRALSDDKGFAGVVTDIAAEAVCRAAKRASANGYVAISGYNSPEQIMVAGVREASKSFDDEIDKAGGQFIPFRMVPMKADAPYHSRLMRYLVPEFVGLVDDIELKAPAYPVWSTVTGWRIKSSSELRSILVKQITSPVLWSQALGRLRNRGVDMMLDIGPNKIARNLVRENARLPVAYAFDDEADREAIADAFGKAGPAQQTTQCLKAA